MTINSCNFITIAKRKKTVNIFINADQTTYILTVRNCAADMNIIFKWSIFTGHFISKNLNKS